MAAGVGLAALPGGCRGSDDVTGPEELGPVTVRVLDRPVPVTAEGETQVVYEIRVTNPAGNPVVRLAGLAITAAGAPVADYSAGELQQLLNVPDLDVPAGEPGRLVFVWLSFPHGQVPSTLTNTVAFANTTETREAAATVESRQLGAMRSPLEGAGWVAANIGNRFGHRRAVWSEDGDVLRLAQRFAIDWVRIDEDGRSHVGDSRQNQNYYAYGQPVLAVADGRIAHTTDGIPENTPPTNAVEITLETLGGNRVILDLADGTSAFYGHLIPGSIRVSEGDLVRAGDTLGLVGNSGNSTEPHLHLHFSRVYNYANSAVDADGLPFVFDSFEIIANRPVLGMRHREMPLTEAVLRFP